MTTDVLVAGQQLTHGRLGECYFQGGEAAKAVAPTRHALELCERHGDAEGVKALSTMPSLPELRARLLGLMQAPAAQLVRLLNTPASQLARVLKAHQEKVEEK